MNCGKGNGYTRVDMSFNVSLNIKQTGHAMLHIDQHDEDHLVPFSDFKVQGFLSGHLYLEIESTYHHITSSGFLSEIKFSGRGLFSGVPSSVQATLYRSDDEAKSSPVYVIRGLWNGNFTIFTGDGHTVVEKWRPEEHPSAPLEMPDVAEQDPWETRKERKDVIALLRSGDLGAVTKGRSILEEAQRAMRKEESRLGRVFEPLLFKQVDLSHGYPRFENLAVGTGWALDEQRTKGVCEFD